MDQFRAYMDEWRAQLYHFIFTQEVPDVRKVKGLYFFVEVFSLSAAQSEVFRHLVDNPNNCSKAHYMLFKNTELSYCRDNLQCSLAIPPPVAPVSACMRPGIDHSEFKLTQMPSDTGSYMCMLKRRGRTWAVKLSKSDAEYVKRELRNHMLVHENMRRWSWAVEHLYYSTRGHLDSAPSKTRKPKARRPKCPRIPKLEREPIAYRVCKHGIAPAGLIMEYIPPMIPAHVRALANTEVLPDVRKSIKNDPNVENVRFQMRLGQEMPPDEGLDTKLLSRPAYLDQFCYQNERAVKEWIDQMAASLAILHWVCKLDGAGVEFHIAPARPAKRTILWMTHFGDCQTLEGGDETTAMAEAFCNNPAWPRPGDSRFWDYSDEIKAWGCCQWRQFMETYASTSNAVLGRQYGDTMEGLPLLFLEKVKSILKDRRAKEQQAPQPE
ncbi:hypothetical protein ACHAPQ_007519 [Fusarium lateritium]